MENIDIPADRVPEGLKPCEQILKRAQEVKKVEPVVAYWCCFYAAQKALKVPKRTKEDTALLMSLLDALEQMKANLADNDAIHNEAAGAAYVQNFALKVFMSADNDDRKGITGKATIRKFVASGQFIEVLNCFENGMTEEMSQKLSYARWKAADGAKALREGRIPTSGPPIPEAELALPDLPTASPSSQPSLPLPTSNTSSPAIGADIRASPRPSPLGGSGKASLPNIDTSLSLPKAASASSSNNSQSSSDAHAPASRRGDMEDDRTPQRTGSWASGAWSTVATPGLADDEAEERRFPPTPTPGTATTGTTNSGAGASAGAGPSGSTSPAVLTPKLPKSTIPTDPTSPRSPNTGEKKNVRFMGPDGAPLSPAHTVFTVDSYDAPAAPPPTMFNFDSSADAKAQAGADGDGSAPSTARPKAGPQSQSQPTSAVPGGGTGMTTGPGAAGGTGNANGGGGGRTRSGSTNGLGLHNTTEPPRTAPPSHPIQPSAPLQPTGPPPSAPPLHSMPTASTQAYPPPKPTRKTVEQCQKHARWAISALEFDDPETARNELRKALALLG